MPRLFSAGVFTCVENSRKLAVNNWKLCPGAFSFFFSAVLQGNSVERAARRDVSVAVFSTKVICFVRSLLTLLTLKLCKVCFNITAYFFFSLSFQLFLTVAALSFVEAVTMCLHAEVRTIMALTLYING